MKFSYPSRAIIDASPRLSNHGTTEPLEEPPGGQPAGVFEPLEAPPSGAAGAVTRDLQAPFGGLTYVSYGNFWHSIVMAALQSRGYRSHRFDCRPVGPVDPLVAPESLGPVVHLSRSPRALQAMVERRAALAGVEIERGQARVLVGGRDPQPVDELFDFVFSQLPEPEARDDDDGTRAHYWYEANGSGVSSIKRLEAVRWEGVRKGYTTTVRAELDPLMSLAGPPRGGRLLLWHGEPGTGKTHAIRALAHAWREWCELHFVADPDHFLGGGVGYMVDLLGAEELSSPHGRRHKLVVLEDAGELLAADARQQTGQALSRLLNLSDGLLAAGTRALLLITTNEPIGRLHPAIQRPGRCTGELEFTPLSAVEANRWLEDRGCAQRVDGAATLAQLFALADGRCAGRTKPSVGFG